jgi:protein SCO1/2
MHRRVLILATVAAALAVVAIELVIRRVATEPQALPASIRRTAARPDGPLPTLWSVPAYQLADQDGKTRTPQDLRGSVWVADFIFTSCKSICPVLTAKMVQVQRAVPDARLKFVSFSVDPERDTPEALHAYAKRWAPDERRWTLLATTKESLARLTRGMKTLVEPQPDPDATLHSGELFLIDEKGRVRGLYSSDGESFAQLVPDARKLLSELEGTPTTGDTSASMPEDGATLYRRAGCAGCHEVPAIAPPLAGLGGRKVMLADGRTTTATAEVHPRVDPRSGVQGRGHVPSFHARLPWTSHRRSGGRPGAVHPGAEAARGRCPDRRWPARAPAVDPVCGMSIHAGPDTLHVTHDGRTVYFCSEHCRDRFVANPTAFNR